jgi:hypothetical protein
MKRYRGRQFQARLNHSTCYMMSQTFLVFIKSIHHVYLSNMSTNIPESQSLVATSGEVSFSVGVVDEPVRFRCLLL